MADQVAVKRALLSVSDKDGVVEFARTLAGLGVELISTGGTARVLAEAGLTVTPIEAVTGLPEMMDGRVKTLHPAVHGGLLARRDDAGHAAAMAEHGIAAIDLVCINLYPFEATVARPGVVRDEAIEQIDIGGPSMIRSAAKNAAWVTVVTSPEQYPRVAAELTELGGSTSGALRRELAAAAFARTAAYDRAIAGYLAGAGTGSAAEDRFPASIGLELARVATLRYGENPHQGAAVYAWPAGGSPSVVGAEQIGGKELSYNNILDAAAALELVRILKANHPGLCGAVVVKHTNPCGAAIAEEPARAIRLAVAGDPVAAYGGILAVNRPLSGAEAGVIGEVGAFFEVIIAPSFGPGAAEALHARWKNVRLLAVGPMAGPVEAPLEFRSVPGGMLVQERDVAAIEPSRWEHRAGPVPSDADLGAAAFLVACVRALSSNAVVLGGREDGGDSGVRLFGAGAGQMDRVQACRIAVAKAGERAAGSIAASEAFFPFADGPAVLIEAGARLIVHPGGSKRDQETFDLCASRGVSCVTTGMRHFRH